MLVRKKPLRKLIEPISNMGAGVAVKRDSSWLQLTALLLTISFVVLYAFGYLFFLGYHEELGIDTDLFPRSPDIHAVKGLIGVMLSVEHFPRYDISSIWSLLVVSGLVFLVFYLLGSKKTIDSKSVKNQKNPNLSNAIIYGLITLFSPLAVAYILILLMICLVPYHWGEMSARNFLKNNLKITCGAQVGPQKNPSFHNCVSVTNSKFSADGILLTSNNEAVAVLTTEAVVIVGLKESYQIIRPRHLLSVNSEIVKIK